MQATDVHPEPFVHLVDLSHDRVLVAWGAFFFFRDERSERWEIVDDSDLAARVGRRTCIGHSAEPAGSATVEVLDEHGDVVASAQTEDSSWVWVEGLAPDTE